MIQTEYQIIDVLKTYEYGYDYLVAYNEKLYRLRKLKSKEYFDIDLFSEFERDLELYKENGLILPEVINFNTEKPELLFPYNNEIPTNKEINIDMLISAIGYFFDLIDKMTHNINFIPSMIDLSDIYIDKNENKYLIVPLFKNFRSSNAFEISPRNETGEIEVMGKIIQYLQRNYSGLNNSLDDFLDNLNKMEIDCVSDYSKYFKKKFAKYESVKIKEPQFTDRKNERDLIYNTIKYNEGFKMFFTYGPQRAGKSKLMSIVKTELVSSYGYNVIEAKTKEDIYFGLLQIASSVFDSDEIYQNRTESINASIINLIELYNSNKKKKIALFIDDFQDFKHNFLDLLDILINYEYKFPFAIFITTHDHELVNSYKNIIPICVDAFTKNDTKNLISSMISHDFVSDNIEFVDLVYNISQGYPGNVREIIKNFENSGVIAFDNGEWKAKITKIVVKDFFGYIDDKVHKINPGFKEELKYLSILGQSFFEEDIALLSKILGKNFKIRELLELEIIIKEGKLFRFFNLVYWQKFYSKLSSEEKKKLHLSLAENTDNFEKKIWHLKSAKEKRKAAFQYVIKMKKCYDEWIEIDQIKKYFIELEELGIVSDSALIIFSKLMFSERSMDKLFKYSEKLKHKKHLKYYYLLIKLEKKDEKVIKDIDKKLKEKNITEYEILCLNYLKLLYYNERRSEKEPLETVENIYKEITHIYNKNKMLKAFNEIYLESSRIFCNFLELTNSARQMKLIEECLEIARDKKLRKQQMEFSIFLSDKYLNNPILNETYTKEVKEMAEKSHDFRRLADTYIQIGFTAFYSGNIDIFNRYMNEGIKYAKLAKNLMIEIDIKWMKCLYYFHNEDFSNFDLDYFYKIAEDIEYPEYVRKKAKERGDDLKLYRSLFLNDINELEKLKVSFKSVRANYLDAVNLLELSLEKDNMKIKERFNKIFEFLFFKEESLLFFYNKMSINEDLKNLYSEKAFELIEELKENNYKLSLAMAYEGVAKFFAISNPKSFDTFKYFRLSINFYKNLGFNIKAEKLEKLLHKYFDIPYEESENKTNPNEEIQQLNKKLKFYDDVVALSMSILILENVQDIADKTLEFINKRLPVKRSFIKIISKSFEVESSIGINVFQQNEYLSMQPFEMYYTSRHKDFVINYYLSNESIVSSFELIEEVFDSIIMVDSFLSASVDRIVHIENSITDFLTGVYSRRYIYLRLEEEYNKSKRINIPISVIIYDIDNFKKYNDTYGHKMGDEVLKYLSRITKDTIRVTDILGRYGGEEFLIVLPSTSGEQAYAIAERIRSIFELNSEKEFGIKITASFGVSSLERHPDIKDYNQLVEFADEGAYSSKSNGKNYVTLI